MLYTAASSPYAIASDLSEEHGTWVYIVFNTSFSKYTANQSIIWDTIFLNILPVTESLTIIDYIWM